MDNSCEGAVVSYLAQLSKAQCRWLIGTLIIAVGVVAFGWISEPKRESVSVSSLTVEMSIREIAPKLNATGKALARELDLPLDVPKARPLRKLGVGQEKFDHAVQHLLSHRPTQLKYYVFAALVLWGLVFLSRLGRPDGSPVSARRTWYPRAPYVLTLLVAVLVCGFVLGKSPNPMEGAVKVFKSMAGLYPSVWDKLVMFLFFIGLAIVGNKLVCGWACPFGALQELLYSLPMLKRAKRRRVPFAVANLVRSGLFLLMLLLLFGIIGGKEGFVVYHLLNPFNLFNFDFEALPILITIVVVLVLALAIYRPFCQFICPFGLISWLAERLSLVRVRVDQELCTACGACVRACPSDAAKSKVQGGLFGADCYSCARCLNVCPADAIAYRCVFGNRDREVSVFDAARIHAEAAVAHAPEGSTAPSGTPPDGNAGCPGTDPAG
jgi:ferredoxin